MFNIQPLAKHPLSNISPEIDKQVYEAMWALFAAICRFWGTIADPAPHRTQLLNFMLNRIKLNPLYSGYYATASEVLARMQAEHGEAAYEMLLTDKAAASEDPPVSPLAVARQRVSNELVALHLAVGGFKAFGAKNYCGFIAGPNLPGHEASYRTGAIK
jgi:hypothetical protein